MCPSNSYFFTTQLTSTEIFKLKCKLQSKTKKDENCKLWTGAQRNGYGILEVRFRGNKIKLPVHRLTYFLENRCLPLQADMHVSHLCHNKLCCEILHLSFEPQKINNNRQICKSNGECSGHHGYQNCTF